MGWNGYDDYETGYERWNYNALSDSDKVAYDKKQKAYSKLKYEQVIDNRASNKNKKGGEKKMAKKEQSKKARRWFTANPAKRGKQFASELKIGKNKYGEELTNTQKAFRSGYLSRGTDSAAVYNYNKKKKK